jgi:hypothetical protein
MVMRAAMQDRRPEDAQAVDPRHAGRTNDKEMPIEQPGMEMSKPGFPDLRRRKHTVSLPNHGGATKP